MKKDERKKEKESEENRGNQAFRPIMERLLGKGLEQGWGQLQIGNYNYGINYRPNIIINYNYNYTVTAQVQLQLQL